MRRKFFIFSVALVASITLKPILITALQNDVQQKNEKKKLLPQQKKKTESAKPNAADDIRGTNKSPLVVQVQPTPKTPEEAANEKAKEIDQSAANWWMVKLTAIIAVVGFIQIIVFGLQARRLKQTIDKMDEVAEGQTNDMQASITEATKSAKAMEGIAESMARNVESVRESVAITREIANQQKLVTELQTRPYLAIAFLGVINQDTTTNFRFEPRIVLVNKGSTPARKIRFVRNADVLPYPLRGDFDFPLDKTHWFHGGDMGSAIEKIIGTPVPKLYPDVEAEQIKMGVGQRIFVWGKILYEDPFGHERFVKFGISCFILRDGKTWMSEDTTNHNDSN